MVTFKNDLRLSHRCAIDLFGLSLGCPPVLYKVCSCTKAICCQYGHSNMNCFRGSVSLLLWNIPSYCAEERERKKKEYNQLLQL